MSDKPRMRLIAAQQALLDAASSAASSSVYGHVRVDEQLVQILMDELGRSAGFEALGTVRFGSDAGPGELHITTGKGDVVFTPRSDLPAVAEVEIVDVTESMASRRVGLVPSGGLRTKRVLLVGAGSVGSVVGLLLAQAGVGEFYIVDNDLLDGANLARHACDLADLGRWKAAAVADLLTRRSAYALSFFDNVVNPRVVSLDTLLKGMDVVVASTDSPEAQFVVNEACITNKKPGVFVGAYEEAGGGEILVVRPGEGPCFYCAVGFRAGAVEGVRPKERREAYWSADTDRLVAEPGLGVDVAYLATVAAMHVLAVLDPDGKRASLVRAGREFLLLHGGSTPRGALTALFDAPFEFLPALVRREAPCPVCGWSSRADR